LHISTASRPLLAFATTVMSSWRPIVAARPSRMSAWSSAISNRIRGSGEILRDAVPFALDRLFGAAGAFGLLALAFIRDIASAEDTVAQSKSPCPSYGSRENLAANHVFLELVENEGSLSEVERDPR